MQRGNTHRRTARRDEANAQPCWVASNSNGVHATRSGQATVPRNDALAMLPRFSLHARGAHLGLEGVDGVEAHVAPLAHRDVLLELDRAAALHRVVPGKHVLADVEGAAGKRGAPRGQDTTLCEAAVQLGDERAQASQGRQAGRPSCDSMARSLGQAVAGLARSTLPSRSAHRVALDTPPRVIMNSLFQRSGWP
jgi:hypothetical protein